MSTVEAPGRSKLLRWGHELRLSCIPSISAEFERSECVCVTCSPPASHPAGQGLPRLLLLQSLRRLSFACVCCPPSSIFPFPSRRQLVCHSLSTAKCRQPAISRSPPFPESRAARSLEILAIFPFPSAALLSCLQRFNAFSSQPACQPAICLAHIPPTLSRFPLIALLHTPAPLHTSPIPDHGPCSCGLSIIPSSISLTGPRVL